jgi:hypothetical protein
MAPQAMQADHIESFWPVWATLASELLKMVLIWLPLRPELRMGVLLLRDSVSLLVSRYIPAHLYAVYGASAMKRTSGTSCSVLELTDALRQRAYRLVTTEERRLCGVVEVDQGAGVRHDRKGDADSSRGRRCDLSRSAYSSSSGERCVPGNSTRSSSPS